MSEGLEKKSIPEESQKSGKKEHSFSFLKPVQEPVQQVQTKPQESNSTSDVFKANSSKGKAVDEQDSEQPTAPVFYEERPEPAPLLLDFSKARRGWGV